MRNRYNPDIGNIETSLHCPPFSKFCIALSYQNFQTFVLLVLIGGSYSGWSLGYVYFFGMYFLSCFAFRY